MPGCPFYEYADSDVVLRSLLSDSQFGFPLQFLHALPPETKVDKQVRAKEAVFFPMLPLPEVDKIDHSKGYLIGTTNQLFLNFPKLKADLVVDLDKQTWYCPEPPKSS